MFICSINYELNGEQSSNPLYGMEHQKKTNERKKKPTVDIDIQF